MKKTAIFFFSIFSLMLILPPHSKVSAEEAQKAPQDIGFNYQSIHPDNQQNKDVGYFDLRMTPGQKQTVQIELSNPGDFDKTIEVAINSGKTNGNGVIEAGVNQLKKDASLKYDLADLVQAPKSVKLAPHEKIMLNLDISMPQEPYDGIIFGGIQLKEKTNDVPVKSGIINEYAFVISMVLSENDQKVKPEMKLNKVYPSQNNARNAIFINLSNTQPDFLDYLTVDVQISKKGDKEVLYDKKSSNMRMAPNTMMNFPVSMQGDKMEPGKYTAHILAVSGKSRWEWKKDFTITDEEADKFNEQDVSLIQDPGVNWKLVAMIVGGVLVLVLIIFILIKSLKKQKNTKTNADKKRKKSKVKH